MTKKRIIIAISFLIVGLSIGIGVSYYVIPNLSKGKSSSNSSKGISTNLLSGTKLRNRSKIAAQFYCPCGRCSDKLFECKCPIARDVTRYLNSLIAKPLSENEIREKMVRKYGESIVGDEPPVPPYYESVEGVELPATLDPELVSEKAREAYQIAKTYPELLMQMPCYCGCDKARGKRKAHKSLLYCFTDKHGDNCRICMNDAIFARDKVDQGMNPEEIRNAIIKKRGHMRS